MKIGNGEWIIGDCFDAMAKIPDGSVDMVVTSPPYDDLRSYGGSLKWSFEIFAKIAQGLTRVLKTGGIIVWNVSDATIKGSETGTSFRQALYFKDVCGLNLHDTMIYHKSSQPKQNGYRYEQHFEYMFVLAKGKPANVHVMRELSKQAGRKTFRTSRDGGKEALVKTPVEVSETKSKGNVWFYGTKENKTGHPAVFPVELAQDHIISWSNPQDIILDPFGGSGTTAIAAERSNRRWICIERDEEYSAKAIARIEGETQSRFI